MKIADELKRAFAVYYSEMDRCERAGAYWALLNLVRLANRHRSSSVSRRRRPRNCARRIRFPSIKYARVSCRWSFHQPAKAISMNRSAAPSITAGVYTIDFNRQSKPKRRLRSGTLRDLQWSHLADTNRKPWPDQARAKASAVYEYRAPRGSATMSMAPESDSTTT